MARAAGSYIHAAVGLSVLLAIILEVGDAATAPGGRWITWQAPVVLAIVAGTYLGHRAFFRQPLALFAMAMAGSLAVLSAGAYGMSMSSNYNGRPRAAEVLVDGKHHHLIRRRETYEDLIRPEVDF